MCLFCGITAKRTHTYRRFASANTGQAFCILFFLFFLLTFIFTLLDFSHITDLYGFAWGVFSQTRHSSVSEVLVGQEGVFLVPTDPANSLMEMERTMWVWYSPKNTCFRWKSSRGATGKSSPPPGPPPFVFLTVGSGICRFVWLMEMLIAPKKVNPMPFCVTNGSENGSD